HLAALPPITAPWATDGVLASQLYGRTDTCDGSSRAPGPGSPVVALMSVDSVRGMQNSAALTSVWPSVPGRPVRVMLPPFRVGKHGVAVLFAQQSCEMPPFASMQLPPEVATHAAPVPTAVQLLPAPQASSWVCGPAASLQGVGPTSGVDSPVVKGSWMSSVPFGCGLSPCGAQSLDSS